MGVYLTKMNTTTNKVEKFKVASNGAIYNNTEVVYDMTSSDASKNWGYTNGIQGGVTVSGKDFSKYDKLIFYGYRFGIMNFCAEIDITIPTKSPNLFGRATSCFHFIEANVSYTAGMTIELNTSLTGFTAKFNQNTVDQNSNAEWFVAKIEGVLKTPSMIYTGDELISGNGISIENGVISNITNILSSYYNRKPSAITTTSSIDITTGTFTKKSATSKIIVLASAYIQDSTGGYGSVLRVNIDGSEAVSSLSNASKEHCILCPISNRASGNHTFSLQLVAGAGSATIPSYNDIYLTFLEVE